MSWTIRVEKSNGSHEIISAAENFPDVAAKTLEAIKKNKNSTIPVLGITGTGGSGKSSLVDELGTSFFN
jgi:methylmalonyl-CoA mutase